MALLKTPILDHLNNNSFEMEVLRIPIFKYAVQNANLAGLSIPEVRQGSPFQAIMQVGDCVAFDPITFDFLVDENLDNWLVFYYWITGLGFNKSFEQFNDFISGVYERYGIKKEKDIILSQFSDVTLTMLTNHKNPYLTFRFIDCFPTTLSPLTLTTTDGDAQPIMASITFQYTGMEVIRNV